MTNLEKIRKLDSKKLIELINCISNVSAKEYIDWVKWLDSPIDNMFWENGHFSFPLKSGKKISYTEYKGDKDKESGFLVENTTMLGSPYGVVVTEEYKVKKIPMERIEVIK